jgi:hypothetical protein
LYLLRCTRDLTNKPSRIGVVSRRPRGVGGLINGSEAHCPEKGR